ncbi:hypothetical protein J3A83DRAFT_4375401 [Scleroderma citrinum]
MANKLDWSFDDTIASRITGDPFVGALDTGGNTRPLITIPRGKVVRLPVFHMEQVGQIDKVNLKFEISLYDYGNTRAVGDAVVTDLNGPAEVWIVTLMPEDQFVVKQPRVQSSGKTINFVWTVEDGKIVLKKDPSSNYPAEQLFSLVLHTTSPSFNGSEAKRMRLGDYTASTLVDGKELEEYEVTVGPGATHATCWVASEAGKTFAYLSCQDDEALLEIPVSQHFGEISLEIKYGKGVIQRHTTARGNRTLNLTTKRHEKSMKKLSSHCVGFGPEDYCPPGRVVDFTPNQDPPITFAFKYRPLEILQANGIAPQHSDISSDIAVPKNDTTAVLERINLLENELKRLRDQVDDPAQDIKPKRVKKEHNMSEKLPPFISEEVIDLT